MKLRIHLDKVLYIAFILVAIFLLSCCNQLAMAVQGGWVSNPIVTTSDTPTLSAGQDTCAIESRMVAGNFGPIRSDVCIYSMDGIDFAGGGGTWFVGFGDNAVMYPFYTGSQGKLVYVPHSPYLVTFANSTETIPDGYNFYTPDQLQLDASGKKYILSAGVTPAISISPRTVNAYENGFAYSMDGTWVVTGLVAASSEGGGGVARANLKTKKIDIVYQTNTSTTIQWGATPYPFALAVSNDGQEIAFSGSTKNLGLRTGIVLADDQCAVSTVVTPSTICSFVDMTSALGDAGMGISSSRPESGVFSVDGKELELKYSQSSGSVWVQLTIDNNARQIDYLALGDSYSSGEGDFVVDAKENHTRFLPNTDEEGYPREMCHISYSSYPMQLRDLYAINTDYMRSVACSGAKTTDIDRSSRLSTSSFTDNYHGQYDRLKYFPREEEYQRQALINFIPGRIEQVEFIKRYKPKVITVNIGGNDVGFAGLIMNCVKDSNSECPEAKTDGVDRQRLAKLIRSEFFHSGISM